VFLPLRVPRPGARGTPLPPSVTPLLPKLRGRFLSDSGDVGCRGQGCSAAAVARGHAVPCSAAGSAPAPGIWGSPSSSAQRSGGRHGGGLHGAMSSERSSLLTKEL